VKLALAVVLAALVLAPAAEATSATSAQVRALAARSGSDAQALAALRAVDRVDGRPADIRGALAGASGAALRARLRALAGSGQVAETGDPAADARQITSGHRFHETPVPRPLHGTLAWLGQKLRWFHKPFDWLAGRVPGGASVLWLILAALVVGAAIVAATRLARRRAGAAIERSQRLRQPGEPDPAQLEAEADEAERQGDLERALRLRFRAGLLRLARADAIPPERSLTSGDVRRALHLAEFDGIATSFDEVVYGRRPASAEEVAASREAWRAVLDRVTHV
jgi:uncharacterized protein DUF4129